MKIPFVYNTLIIFIAIGLIAVSTATLSFFSYYYTVGSENPAKTSLIQSNNKLALNYRDRIEQKIVDNDLILSDMVDVNEPREWPAMVEAIKKADLNVDQVYLLRQGKNLPLYPPYSDDIQKQWRAFRTNFDVREIDWEKLVPGQPHHLHKERKDNYFFATFILKEASDGSRILVCYQMNLEKITALLDKYLRDLQDRFYVSIVDFENNGIYSQPIPRVPEYFYETRFRSTLYKWILQILPRNYNEIETNLKNQRRTNLFLIALSISLIFISLAIIYNGWKRDRQLRQLKENFISNVSHELKTPLSLIRMFSEILIMGRVASEDKKREYYKIINNESDRMSRLINNLLDFASLIRGIEHKHFERTNIAQLVTKAVEAYRYEILQDGFQLDLKKDPGIPDSFVDPNAITMAFLNLLDNSVKYSGDRKQIQVRIEKSDGFVNLAVVDKGIGIPLSEQQRIFDKFYRGNDASVRGIRGSGIGLAITKHVAEMHGGNVVLESEPGKGSEFTLRIPIRTSLEESKS